MKKKEHELITLIREFLTDDEHIFIATRKEFGIITIDEFENGEIKVNKNIMRFLV